MGTDRPWLVTVDRDLRDVIVDRGLGSALPGVRSVVLDTVLSVGTSASMLVTLMQGPDTIRAFAALLRDRVRGHDSAERIEIRAHRHDREVRLDVTGDVDVDVIADFLRAALDPPSDD